MVLAASLGAIGMLGSLGSAALNSVNARNSAEMQFAYQKQLAQLQYDLNQRSLRESPTNARKGYELAGINPILPYTGNAGQSPTVGLGSSALSSVSPVDFAGAITNGYQTFKLNRLQTQSNIALQGSQSNLNNAQAQTQVSQQQLNNAQAQLTLAQKQGQIIQNLHLPKLLKSQILLNNNMAQAQLINANANMIGSNANVTNARANMISATSGNLVKTGTTVGKNIVNSLPNNVVTRYIKKIIP